MCRYYKKVLRFKGPNNIQDETHRASMGTNSDKTWEILLVWHIATSNLGMCRYYKKVLRSQLVTSTTKPIGQVWGQNVGRFY